MKVVYFPLPPGVEIVRDYPRQSYSLLTCSHDEGFRRQHDGDVGLVCRMCRGDAQTTESWSRPVKFLADVKKPPREAPVLVTQEALF